MNKDELEHTQPYIDELLDEANEYINAGEYSNIGEAINIKLCIALRKFIPFVTEPLVRKKVRWVAFMMVVGDMGDIAKEDKYFAPNVYATHIAMSIVQIFNSKLRNMIDKIVPSKIRFLSLKIKYYKDTGEWNVF